MGGGLIDYVQCGGEPACSATHSVSVVVVSLTLALPSHQGHTVQPYVVNKWSLPLLIPFGLLLTVAAPFIGVASASASTID